ncbi:DUF222 domain-containing protein [Nakamurella sp. A5-74]|uniref:DUF222 domain-containing protein n=1 Tax=Nakamurella sp. A5-74 TaxID=3158264 RepID=A0AAU8DIK5_9ACTN
MNSTGGAIVADTRAHIATLAAELKTLHSSIFQCPSAELGVFLAELAEIRALAGAASVIVTADAETRGAVEASQSASTRGWVAEHGWHSRREASTIAKAAHILRRPDLAEIADSIRTADLDLTTAVVVQGEYDKLVPELLPDAPPIVLKHLVNHGAEYGPRGVRELRQWILAHHGKPDEFANFQERCRRHISLSSPTETSTGLHEYRLVVDNEGLSILEAAIQTLAAPRPDAVTGERDSRPTDRRRGQAVIEALRRSVLAQGQGVTAAPTAIVHVTMNLDDLQQRTGAGTCISTIADGTLLAPDTVRKIACDAGIIPTVLGSDGAVLDCGTEKRLFTLPQKRLLWQRDRHCTFPGCDIPAHWTDAHHLVHWIDGGPTDLNNAALLCRAHHTFVHRDELHGKVAAGQVVWDQRPGSYRPTPRPRRVQTPIPPGPLLLRQRSAPTPPLRT